MAATGGNRLAWSLDAGSRRATLKLAATGGLAAVLGSLADGASARKKKRKKKCKKRKPGVCAGENWCIDRTSECGPEDGFGKCFVEATGGNICGEILYQAADCAACDPGNCTDCVCVLAAGGGDHCNNGASGYEFICVRPV